MEGVLVFRVGRAGEGHLANGFGDEFGFTVGFHFAVAVVLKKARFVERVEEMFFKIADLNLARNADKFRAEVEGGLDTVKAFQSAYQGRRDQQRGVGVVIWIADVEARIFVIDRGNEIKVEAEPGQRFGHDSF